MLVKDELANIRRAVEQALPVVDHVTILDTGSTDGTLDELRDMQLRAMTIHEREWDGFGPSRSALLELARPHTDYTLMLDADMTLHIHCVRCGTDHAPAQSGGGDPTGPSGTGCYDVLERPDLTADEYMLRIRDDGGRLPLLTRNSHPFRYEGVAHAYLTSDEPASVLHTDWLSVDGGPGASREKIQGDRVLLEQAFIENPDDARTVFYLAQTYKDLDLPELAIRFYRMRAEMHGFAEERYWARYQLGVLLGENVAFADGAPELLTAWRERPHRAEALRALANLANSVADKIAEPDDVLFVKHAAYRKAAA